MAAAAPIIALVLFFPGPGFSLRLELGFSGGLSGDWAKTADRFTSISGQVTGGRFSGRRYIWETSWRLMRDRPWVEFEPLSLSFLCPVVGSGPDLFRTTYLLKSQPRGPRLLPGEAHQAHNLFLHAGVELGFLGLLASLGIFGIPMLAAGHFLLWIRRDYSINQRVILLMVLAVIAGRGLEQIVGLARVSDLTMFWALLAVMAAIPGMAADGNKTNNDQPGPGGVGRDHPRPGKSDRKPAAR